MYKYVEYLRTVFPATHWNYKWVWTESYTVTGRTKTDTTGCEPDLKDSAVTGSRLKQWYLPFLWSIRFNKVLLFSKRRAKLCIIWLEPIGVQFGCGDEFFLSVTGWGVDYRHAIAKTTSISLFSAPQHFPAKSACSDHALITLTTPMRDQSAKRCHMHFPAKPISKSRDVFSQSISDM